MSSLNGIDISSSTVQGLFTWPEMLNNFVPEKIASWFNKFKNVIYMNTNHQCDLKKLQYSIMSGIPTCVSRPAERGEPRASPPADGRRHGHGLHVGHGGRATEHAHVSRERRLQPRLALLSLERLDQGRFLTADVGAGAAVAEHVKVVPGSAGVLTYQCHNLVSVAGIIFMVNFKAPSTVPTEESLRVRLLYGHLQIRRLVVEFATDVDVGRARAHCSPGDEAALNLRYGLYQLGSDRWKMLKTFIHLPIVCN